MTDCAPNNAFRRCLFFSGNALSRSLERLASECFADSGLSPSHAYLLKLVITYPGSTPGHLAEVLALAPSTVTRFADALQRKGLIERQSHGKQVSLHATAAGEAKRPAINAATDRLMAAFTQTLGLEGTTTLTGDIANAIDAIEGLIGDPERLAALSASAVATTASETADSG